MMHVSNEPDNYTNDFNIQRRPIKQHGYLSYREYNYQPPTFLLTQNIDFLQHLIRLRFLVLYV